MLGRVFNHEKDEKYEKKRLNHQGVKGTKKFQQERGGQSLSFVHFVYFVITSYLVSISR